MARSDSRLTLWWVSPRNGISTWAALPSPTIVTVNSLSSFFSSDLLSDLDSSLDSDLLSDLVSDFVSDLVSVFVSVFVSDVDELLDDDDDEPPDEPLDVDVELLLDGGGVDVGGGVDWWPDTIVSETSVETRAIYNAQLNDLKNVD